MQRLALNNFFGKLKKAEWVSYIRLAKKREAEIHINFSCALDFWYPSSIEELDDLLEEKSRRKEISDDDSAAVNNIFGEKSNCDRLIVMEDVSGFADESKIFASFLTVAPKYNYNCVYIFHLIYPEKATW